MHYLIYKITNRLNNKIYVGKHKTDDKNDEYFGSGLLLGRAVEKHGKENFVKEILFECATEKEMNQRETDIVDVDFIARDDTYNVMLGGNGGFDYINKNKLWKTESWCAIVGKNAKLAAKARIRHYEDDPEWAAECYGKISNSLIKFYSVNKNPFTGKHHTEEAKLKMRKSHQGKHGGAKNGVFGKHWVTNGTESKMVDKNTIPLGWRKGHVNNKK